MIERSIPSSTASEREMLESWLDFNRATLAMKCDGLTTQQLKLRAVAPSSLSLIGPVRHGTEVTGA